MDDRAAWVGALATLAAALGTVGTLIAALWQIGTDRSRRRAETREEQARRISAWVGGAENERDPEAARTAIFLLNRSDEPVYNIVATIVAVQGAAPHRGEDWEQTQVAAPRTTVVVIPPGRWRVWVPHAYLGGPMYIRWGVEIAFTDRAGVHWIRRGTGRLEELSESPLDYFAAFGVHAPHNLVRPEPADD